MNSKPRAGTAVAAIAACAAALLACVSCKTTPDDPRDQIPEWNRYRNEGIGFGFQYPPILELEEDDRARNGAEVMIVYPGMRSVVFRVDVRGALAGDALVARKIPGTESTRRIDGRKGHRFQIANGGQDGQPGTVTVVKNDGWLFVFTGTGKTFEEILASFEFAPSRGAATPPTVVDPDDAR